MEKGIIGSSGLTLLESSLLSNEIKVMPGPGRPRFRNFSIKGKFSLIILDTSNESLGLEMSDRLFQL